MTFFYFYPTLKIFKYLNTIYFSYSKKYTLKYICSQKSNLFLNNTFLFYNFWKKKNYKIIYQLLGLSTAIFQDLHLIGRGFRIQETKSTLIFKLGFSHNVFFQIPSSTNIHFLKNNTIRIKTKNLNWTSNITYQLKKLKKKNIYNGTGFFKVKDKILLKKWTKKQ